MTTAGRRRRQRILGPGSRSWSREVSRWFWLGTRHVTALAFPWGSPPRIFSSIGNLAAGKQGRERCRLTLRGVERPFGTENADGRLQRGGRQGGQEGQIRRRSRDRTRSGTAAGGRD